MCRWFTETLACLLLLVSTAHADDGWRRHYEAGLSLYSSEEYDPAVKEFQAAYAIRPKPRLLFNIGQSYRSLGNAKEALHYYLLYQAMESNPKPGLKAELEGYIGQMKKIVEQAERARDAEDRDDPPPPPDAGPKPVKTAPPTESTLTLLTPYPLTPAPAPKPVYKRGWFWGVIGGAAAAALITGLAVGLGTSSSPAYAGDTRRPTF
jgi:tetratricopeptide (TPR) repeat protein